MGKIVLLDFFFLFLDDYYYGFIYFFSYLQVQTKKFVYLIF